MLKLVQIKSLVIIINIITPTIIIKKWIRFTGIIDLIEQKVLTYHKKEASQIEKELKGEKTIKVLIMKEGVRIKKGEIKRMKDKIIAKQDQQPL